MTHLCVHGPSCAPLPLETFLLKEILGCIPFLSLLPFFSTRPFRQCSSLFILKCTTGSSFLLAVRPCSPFMSLRFRGAEKDSIWIWCFKSLPSTLLPSGLTRCYLASVRGTEHHSHELFTLIKVVSWNFLLVLEIHLLSSLLVCYYKMV
jgi:hypothetical protein